MLKWICQKIAIKNEFQQTLIPSLPHGAKEKKIILITKPWSFERSGSDLTFLVSTALLNSEYSSSSYKNKTKIPINWIIEI